MPRKRRCWIVFLCYVLAKACSIQAEITQELINFEGPFSANYSKYDDNKNQTSFFPQSELIVDLEPIVQTEPAENDHPTQGAEFLLEWETPSFKLSVAEDQESAHRIAEGQVTLHAPLEQEIYFPQKPSKEKTFISQDSSEEGYPYPEDPIESVIAVIDSVPTIGHADCACAKSKSDAVSDTICQQLCVSVASGTGPKSVYDLTCAPRGCEEPDGQKSTAFVGCNKATATSFVTGIQSVYDQLCISLCKSMINEASLPAQWIDWSHPECAASIDGDVFIQCFQKYHGHRDVVTCSISPF